MTLDTRIMTADELWHLPQDDMRHELIDGELQSAPLNGFEHGVIAANLAAKLFGHIESCERGVVVNGTGFVLRRNPDTVRSPDVAFVKASRFPTGLQLENFFEGSPDLAVEVVSPSDTVDELEEKIADYLAAGCQMVWVVHPKTKSITVYRPTSQPFVLRETDQLDGQDILPGFACSVAEIFASINP